MKTKNPARLFDRLPYLQLPREFKREPLMISTVARARSFVPTHTKIVADNAAEYLLRKYPIGPDGPRTMEDDDWPAFNCPFPRVWIEYRVQRSDDTEHLCGAIVSRADVKSDANEPEAQSLIDALQPSLDDKGVRFIIGFELMDSVGDIVRPRGHLVSYVGENGKHIETFTPLHGLNDGQLKVMGAFALPIIFAMAFMSCSNVERISVSPTREEQRQHQRRHGRSLDRYHVLTIDAKTRAEAVRSYGGEGDGLNPRHIVAGHFAKYGIDGRGLLFGKHVRVVWVPEHPRGNAANGTVTKDYRIGATPTEEVA